MKYLNKAQMLPVTFIYEGTVKYKVLSAEISEGLGLHKDETDAREAASILPNPGLFPSPSEADGPQTPWKLYPAAPPAAAGWRSGKLAGIHILRFISL